jgi:hypothetical protein
VNILSGGGEPTVSLHFMEAIALRAADRIQEAGSGPQMDSCRSPILQRSESERGYAEQRFSPERDIA